MEITDCLPDFGGEFKNRLSDYYGGLDSLKTGWVSNVLFEPSVGNKILHEMVAAENNLKVWKQACLEEVKGREMSGSLK